VENALWYNKIEEIKKLIPEPKFTKIEKINQALQWVRSELDSALHGYNAIQNDTDNKVNQIPNSYVIGEAIERYKPFGI
ncbi:unnamed protein product, partial [marine sediment metagenome]